MSDIEVRVQPTEYLVCAVPPEYADWYSFALTVEWRGHDQWAVMNRRFCLGSDGAWDYEPSPSNREDEWKATHRFDLDTALKLAKEQAPKVTINGWTVQRVLAEGYKEND